MPNQPKKRTPSSFYFSSLYEDPFHRDEDRISQIDFRTFDPFVPEARQTVANCKKHRRQRHELSDKCKHVLAIIDTQEKLLSTKPEAAQMAGYSAQGAPMEKPEISIEFGDGIPEVAKEYVKFWIERSGMVREPFSRQYDVHNIKDEHNHAEKPSIVMMVPFMDIEVADENQFNSIFQVFFQNPKEFAAKYPVGNVRIYSVNKKTNEEDAVGYADSLPIKIVGQEIIGKNLRKARTIKYDPEVEMKVEAEPDEREERLTYEQLFREKEGRFQNALKDIDENIARFPEGPNRDNLLRERKKLIDNYQRDFVSLTEKQRKYDAERKKQEVENLKERKENEANREKEKSTIRTIFENSIPPNRVSNDGNLHPMGRSIQVAEAGVKAPLAALQSMIANRQKQIDEKKLAEDERLRQEAKQLKLEELAPIRPPEVRGAPEAKRIMDERKPYGREMSVLSGETVGEPKPEPKQIPKKEIKPESPILPTAQHAKGYMDIEREKREEMPSESDLGKSTYLNTRDFIIICRLKNKGM